MGEAVLLVRPELAEILAERIDLPVNPNLGALSDDVLLINGRWLADRPLDELPINTCLVQGETIVAARVPAETVKDLSGDLVAHTNALSELLTDVSRVEADDSYKLIEYPWDLITHNADELVRECRDHDKASRIPPTIDVLCPDNVHIGRSADIKPGVVIDGQGGPVWIDDGVTVEPNAVIQGPCYIGPHTVIQPTAIIREGTSIGPVCKIGGELESTIIHGYSNKQHYGFMGHSYVGEWVNMGAGTTISDLKNTYGLIKVFQNGHDPIQTGLMFVGLTIADHSKIGINVCFPSGSVVGTTASVMSSGMAPRFVPSFSWLTDEGYSDYDLDEAAKVIERVMARRKQSFTTAARNLLFALPEITRKYENRHAATGGGG